MASIGAVSLSIVTNVANADITNRPVMAALHCGGVSGW